jgi:acyl-CoA hydrolase
VRALIELAHPDFRDELERTAREYHLIPRRVF